MHVGGEGAPTKIEAEVEQPVARFDGRPPGVPTNSKGAVPAAHDV